jgi:hypothetical protein
MARVALDWHSVTRIVLMDVDLRKFTQIIKMNSRPRIDQPARRRNHKHAWCSTRRPRKCIRVCNLSAKIEPAQKGENIRDGRPTFPAQLSGKGELRLIAQNHSGSFTAGISRREKENPMTNLVLHLAIFNPAEDRRKPALPACFLRHEWKIWCGALELAIQIPER